ncbi:MAG: septum formation initiator family protein [Dysgonamonadaceae bacterium]|jgi:cell division protein FtsB|nr:septum formation initiator family protein [Dysgonamonadaceae bacterium]
MKLILSNIFKQIRPPKNKLRYVIAFIIFAFYTFFWGESTVIKRFSYILQIKQLKKEIDYYTKQKEENLKKLDALHSDNESLEKLAREQYLMTKPNEELFIIKE